MGPLKSLMVFLKELFLNKINLEKVSRRQQKHENLPIMQRVKSVEREFSLNFVIISSSQMSWPQAYKTFSMLNSAEHEMYPTHKC